MNASPEKLRIRFTTHGSNPLVGNIWPGKEATLNAATAKRMVSMGHAEFVDAESTPAKKTPAPKKEEAEKEKATEEAETETADEEGDDDGEGEGTDEGGDDEAADNLDNLNVKKLKKLAKEEGVEISGNMSKDDLISAIRDARAGTGE